MPTSAELKQIHQTKQLFVDNKLDKLGMNFSVWDWTRQELYGLVLGSFVKIGLVQSDLALSTLLSFIIEVDCGYLENPYHSFLHAVDVFYMLHYILIDLNTASNLALDKMEVTSLLVAALTHDILHPGLNNLYHVNAKTDLAAKFNNKSVLENLSCERLKELLQRHDFLDKLDYGVVEPVSDLNGNVIEQIAYMKSLILDAIINTDMCFHFSLLKQLSGKQEEGEDNEVICEADGSSISVLPEHIDKRRKMINVLLHAADISNAARPWELCKRWSDMIVEEFFLQGDAEVRIGIPISPSMDRATTSQAKISIQFNDIIARPFFEALGDVLEPIECYVENLKLNRIEWVSRLVPGEDNDTSVQLLDAPIKVAENGRRGRRMSTVAGTIDIPAGLGRILKTRKRHSFSSPGSRIYAGCTGGSRVSATCDTASMDGRIESSEELE